MSKKTTIRNNSCGCGDVNFLVYLLVILFGISSWVDINGLWVELPILVQNLPEGWDLPSYMSVIIQIANIAPLIFTIVSSIWPHQKFEVPVIYTIICLGAVACLLLSFLWDVTSYIADKEHSTALFALQFCLALVDCTSSVAFLPFMSAFKPQYMTAYFIGEGFSGLIPGLVALGQGAGNMECVSMTIFQNLSIANKSEIPGNLSTSVSTGFNFNHTLIYSEREDVNNALHATSVSMFPVYKSPRFSVKIFFIQLMFLMIASAVAFTLLNFWSYCRRARVVISCERSNNFQPVCTNTNVLTQLSDDVDIIVLPIEETAEIWNRAELSEPMLTKNLSYYKEKTKDDSKNSPPICHLLCTEIDKSSDQSDLMTLKKQTTEMSKMKYGLFLALTAALNAISNGLLPSIQTYSCLPYGIEQYHLSVTLSSIANPVACFASFLLKMKSVKWTLLMSLLGTVLTAYILWTACASPIPPLVDHSAGPVVLILCWVLVVFVITYTKVSIATEFREDGKKALMWFGASTQAGSLLGAVAIFIVVNVFKMLETGNPCL